MRVTLIDPFERCLHAFDIPPAAANLIPNGLGAFAFRLNDSDALCAMEQLASKAGVSDAVIKQAGSAAACKRVHKHDASKRSHLKRRVYRRDAIDRNHWYEIGVSQNVH